jgi:hypothetical protein
MKYSVPKKIFFLFFNIRFSSKVEKWEKNLFRYGIFVVGSFLFHAALFLSFNSHKIKHLSIKADHTHSYCLFARSPIPNSNDTLDHD